MLETIKKVITKSTTKTFITTNDTNLKIVNFPIIFTAKNTFLPENIKVDASLLVNIASKLENPTFSKDGNALIIQDAKAQFKIPIFNNEDEQEVNFDNKHDLGLLETVKSIAFFAKRFNYTIVPSWIIVYKNVALFTDYSRSIAIYKFVDKDINLAIPSHDSVLNLLAGIDDGFVDYISENFMLLENNDVKIAFPVEIVDNEEEMDNIFSNIDLVVEKLVEYDTLNMEHYKVNDDFKNFMSNFASLSDKVTFNCNKETTNVLLSGNNCDISYELDNPVATKSDFTVSFNSRQFNFMLKNSDMIRIEPTMACFVKGDTIILVSRLG